MEDGLKQWILSIRDDSRSSRFRLLGLLPLLFFCLQAVHYYRLGQLGNMLWMCNLGNLLLAIGLLFEQPLLVRIAVIWSLPGLFIWFRYAVVEAGVSGSSTLAHIGGLIVGLFALRQVGMDKVTWVYAFAWYLILQVVSRFVTPEELNVNVAQAIYPSWQAVFNAYWKFWLVMTALVGLIIALLVLLFNRIWPATVKSVSRRMVRTA